MSTVVTNLGATKLLTMAAPLRKAGHEPRERLHADRWSASAEHSMGEVSAGCPNEEVSQLGAKAVGFGMDFSCIKRQRKGSGRSSTFVKRR